MSVQIYGHFKDYLSFSNVSRAIANELYKKRFDVTIYDVASLYPKYINTYPDVGFRMTAHIGIYIGYPELSIEWLHGHAVKVLITVCETDRIPQSWVDACNKADLIVVPSQWCYDAFKNSGVKKQILIVKHGVYAETLKKVRRQSLKYYNFPGFTHVSGSLSFAARKGTSKLLRVYKRLYEENDKIPVLFLKVPKTKGFIKILEHLNCKNIRTFYDEGSLSPHVMAYELRNSLTVIQPSRAEGFGLVPLEARCVGTPTIITNCAGHQEHFVENVDVLISTGSLRPLQTQANAVGAAPLLNEDMIYNGIKTFLENKEYYQNVTKKWADDHTDEWDWSRVLTPLIKELKSIRAPKHKVRLGSSLRGLE